MSKIGVWGLVMKRLDHPGMGSRMVWGSIWEWALCGLSRSPYNLLFSMFLFCKT